MKSTQLFTLNLKSKFVVDVRRLGFDQKLILKSFKKRNFSKLENS